MRTTYAWNIHCIYLVVYTMHIPVRCWCHSYKEGIYVVYTTWYIPCIYMFIDMICNTCAEYIYSISCTMYILCTCPGRGSIFITISLLFHYYVLLHHVLIIIIHYYKWLHYITTFQYYITSYYFKFKFYYIV